MENALFNLNSIPIRAKRIKIISNSYIEKRINGNMCVEKSLAEPSLPSLYDVSVTYIYIPLRVYNALGRILGKKNMNLYGLCLYIFNKPDCMKNIRNIGKKGIEIVLSTLYLHGLINEEQLKYLYISNINEVGFIDFFNRLMFN